MEDQSQSPHPQIQPQIHGHCDPRFNALYPLLRQFLTTDAELGASLAVILDGIPVVDLWAGHTDAARTKPWTRSTIACPFSCTKTITTLATLLLVDRGLLSLDDAVSKHWPAFAAHAKETILIRHLLAHTSGLAGWDDPVTFADLQDTAACTEKLAAQKPWWTPGAASGYHTFTYGFLLGEVVRRVSGKSLTDFIRTELADPLEADFQLGAAEKDWGRVAPLDMAPAEQAAEYQPPAPDSVAARAMRNPAIANLALSANTPEWRRAEVGAANGHCNAMGLARILSVLANGGRVDGKQMLRRETAEVVFEEQVSGTDLVIGRPLRFGVGFALTGEGSLVDWLPAGRIGYWGGFGGSVVVVDAERRMSMAYVMNRASPAMLGSERTKAYVRAVYEGLGVKVDDED